MKQGHSNTSYGPKREPRPMAINPAGVAQIGSALGNHVTDGSGKVNPVEQMHQGRGYKAPSIPSTVHHRGSQRRSD
jgi:hypothetical protein